MGEDTGETADLYFKATNQRPSFTTRPIIMKTKYIGVAIDLFGGQALKLDMLHEGSAGGSRVKDAKMFVKSLPGGQD